VHKPTSEACTALTFDKRKGNASVAANAIKRWKTVRHPGIVRVKDVAETEQMIYVALEKISILAECIESACTNQEVMLHGLYQIGRTNQFINESCEMILGTLSTSTIFVTTAGEWRLGIMELLSSPKEDHPLLNVINHNHNNHTGFASSSSLVLALGSPERCITNAVVIK